MIFSCGSIYSLFLIELNGTDHRRPSSVSSLLEWDFVQKNMAWSVLIVLGGGFALADGAKVNSFMKSYLGRKNVYVQTLLEVFHTNFVN